MTNQNCVYRAQRGVKTPPLSPGSIQARLDAITATDWWAKRYSKIVRCEAQLLPVMKSADGVCFSANGAGVVLAFPKTRDTSMLTICHELAHAVTSGSQGHGPEFAREYLNIVYFVLGQESYVELNEAFIREEVRVA